MIVTRGTRTVLVSLPSSLSVSTVSLCQSTTLPMQEKPSFLSLADDLLCGHLRPLGPDAHDFRNASGHLNHRRHLAGR